MDSPRTKLIKGSIKSAAGALAGVQTAGSLLEPENFHLLTLNGIKHTLAFSGIVVLIAEGRYLWQWIKKWSESDGTLEQALGAAEVATKQAGVAIAEAQDQAVQNRTDAIPPKP